MLSPLPIVYRTPVSGILTPFTHSISDLVYILTPLPMIYQTLLPIVGYTEPSAYGISAFILSSLPMVYQPPVHSIHPFTNYISNSCLWYIKPSTYAVLNPLLVVLWATTTLPHGIVNPNTYILSPLPMVYRTSLPIVSPVYPLYIEPMTMLY